MGIICINVMGKFAWKNMYKYCKLIINIIQKHCSGIDRC